MVYITFDNGLCNALKENKPKTAPVSKIASLQLILEVGDIYMSKNSAINNEIYEVVAGKNAYTLYFLQAHSTVGEILSLNRDEELCFWVDFNDVKQHMNFSFFLRYFDSFKNKKYIEYDSTKFHSIQPKYVYEFAKNEKPLNEDFVEYLEDELYAILKTPKILFKTVLNKRIVAVKDDYFDKYIYEFLSEKPKPCRQIISDIFLKYGRLVVTFDQVVIRLWQLMKDGIVQRIDTKTEYGLFFEYEYKLSDHIDMQRDS